MFPAHHGPILNRRAFLAGSSLAAMALTRPVIGGPLPSAALPSFVPAKPNEALPEYIDRVVGKFDSTLYLRLLGAANDFKEGDQIVGVAAPDEPSRQIARDLLARTPLAYIDSHPPLVDNLHTALRADLDAPLQRRLAVWTFGELRRYLLEQDEPALHAIKAGLSSDVIGCVVKLLTNAELTAISAKLFNPLPGTKIGAKGYLGARIQPNSPTDNVEDIRWQVLNGWAFAVGDVVLGNNPVSSDPHSVAAIEAALLDLLTTFDLFDTLPHCVLSHIDIQAEVEKQQPGATALWFQSIAGSDSANATFDVTLDKMLAHAATRSGPYAFYFETGQGADFTNGHGHGFDMVLHESRKYGFARLLTHAAAQARDKAGRQGAPWVHLNDVAGFIGPEVFRTKEQLVRCCLEDLVMGKLHGLCIGLDVCSTLHMDVSLDDLDWCLEQLAPAQPGYLMALPTKIDPMLGYLTTGYHDHVRLREKFGLKVNDAMWSFFQRLGVIDADGKPTAHFGDPNWVYLQYRRKKQDARSDAEILDEGRAQMQAVRSRGLFLAEGYGDHLWEQRPELRAEVRRIYDDAKISLWAELPADLNRAITAAVPITTRSASRTDYILHPESGEKLSPASQARLDELRARHAGRYDAQIVISDGLNALAIADQQQLIPFLTALRARLEQDGVRIAPEQLVVTSGRVRAGYRIGETLFGGLAGSRAILHVIGERPGSGHRTFSVYMTAPDGSLWGTPGKVDHNVTRVVAGIANTALRPETAAQDVARILNDLRHRA
jgi:ethanolamine ammonia-lyase large subunit